MSLPQNLRPQIAQDDMPNVTLKLMISIKDVGGGLRVWVSNAYSEESWEIGQTFFSNFWWALDAGTIQKSNQYRELRGENPLRLSTSNVLERPAVLHKHAFTKSPTTVTRSSRSVQHTAVLTPAAAAGTSLKSKPSYLR